MTVYAENLIGSVTVGAGGASSISFSSIPSTYTDLYLLVSTRSSNSNSDLTLQVNSVSANYSFNQVYGTGSAAASDNLSGQSTLNRAGRSNGSSTTANTFSTNQIYIPNYAGSTAKSFIIEGAYEDNATANRMALISGLSADTAAISTLTLAIDGGGNFAQYSTAYLYGITNYAQGEVAGGAKAYGGIVTSDSNYYYHTFTSTGTFTPTQSLSADILVVAGGGGGPYTSGGGGGAGGLLGFTSQSLTATNYSVVVGAGGSGAPNTSPYNPSNGSNSSFGALTAAVGGGAGGADAGSRTGKNGGSGGGASGGTGGNTGGTATSGQGNNGGSANSDESTYRTYGGGGGAGAAGGNGSNGFPLSNGNGGVGSSAYSSWGSATGTGQNVSGTYYYAGGGSIETSGGGYGGGGSGRANSNGTANTGGGAGAYWESTSARANGGSGIVIVRYAK